jgi:hypothetical protein
VNIIIRRDDSVVRPIRGIDEDGGGSQPERVFKLSRVVPTNPAHRSPLGQTRKYVCTKRRENLSTELLLLRSFRSLDVILGGRAAYACFTGSEPPILSLN